MIDRIPTESPARILVVDDERSIRDLLAAVVTRAGYRCAAAKDGTEAAELLAAEPFDVVVTDIRMPGLDGLDLVRFVRSTCDCDVVVMTGFASDYEYEGIIAAGAAEFVLKPFKVEEFITRLRRLVRERRVRQQRDLAQKELQRSHGELRESYLDTIRRLAYATEYKDIDTGAHILRIGRVSALLAEAMRLDATAVDDIRHGAQMHDIGKIGIPDTILLKNGDLTEEEFAIMQTHTIIGASILAAPRSSILACAREIALTHHEAWDGQGYPQGLREQEIPLTGRIVKLADVFDALVSQRPYKAPYPVDVAVDLVRRQAGAQFDPALAAAFVDRIDDVLSIYETHPAAGVDFVWSDRDLSGRRR